MHTRRIAIVGPESTGKTTLARQLAETLGGAWVPEYARAYLEELARSYEADDLVHIARGQLASEAHAMAKQPSWLICDTNMLVMRVWAIDKHPEVLPQIKTLEDYSVYEMHVLLRPDLPWEADPLREDEGRQDYLFDMYQRLLEEMALPYAIVEGRGGERLASALAGLGIEIPS